MHLTFIITQKSFQQEKLTKGVALILINLRQILLYAVPHKLLRK